MGEPGQVYIVQADNGLSKIGMVIGTSRENLNFRIRHLRLGSPCALELICSMHSDSVRSFERQLHKVFDNKRAHGEWFELDNRDLEIAKNLLAARKQAEQAERTRAAHRPRMRDAFDGVL